jgi:hypothetical protein
LAFAQNVSDFRFDGKGTITGYDGQDTVLVIPRQINGVPVTALGDRVFRNKGLTDVTLHDGVNPIGYRVFLDNPLTRKGSIPSFF